LRSPSSGDVNDQRINNQESVVEQKAGNPFDDDLPAVAWHYDSFPFVWVTMLSDCAGMVGGETALKTATGEIMKVRGPAMVRCQVFDNR
jgi:hypothetical protein